MDEKQIIFDALRTEKLKKIVAMLIKEQDFVKDGDICVTEHGKVICDRTSMWGNVPCNIIEKLIEELAITKTHLWICQNLVEK